MALNEFELIEKYFQRQLGGVGVSLGIGDDCALLQVPRDKVLATSTDTLVSGVHFPANADPELIADRALRVNLSDLAAMGAEPLWFTLALTMPEPDPYWLEGFSRGLFNTANEYNCALVGGDTTRGPLTITLQVMGSVDLGKALTRGNARPGDVIFVTGCLGDGAAALAVILGELKVGKSAFSYFMSHYYSPKPHLAEGQALAGLASAAIDVSDGLLADLGHICKASGVGATIELERVPVSEALSKLASPQQRLRWVLAGGDDYQLCFTVPRDRVPELQALVKRNRLKAHPIGTITDRGGVTCLHKGQVITVTQTGYQHFDSAQDS